MTSFIQSILFGLTIGGILYIISIGLALTFGAMGIVNFAHGLIYAVGAYAVYTVATLMGAGFIAGVLGALAVSVPLSYVIRTLCHPQTIRPVHRLCHHRHLRYSAHRS